MVDDLHPTIEQDLDRSNPSAWTEGSPDRWHHARSRASGDPMV
jgi:hypothetical protein